MRIKVTWPLVALVVSFEVFLGVVVYALAEAHVIDQAFVKYLVGFLIGSGVTAPIPLVSWFKEKKIRFELNGSDSDPPSGDKEKKP